MGEKGEVRERGGRQRREEGSKGRGEREGREGRGERDGRKREKGGVEQREGREGRKREVKQRERGERAERRERSAKHASKVSEKLSNTKLLFQEQRLETWFQETTGRPSLRVLYQTPSFPVWSAKHASKVSEKLSNTKLLFQEQRLETWFQETTGRPSLRATLGYDINPAAEKVHREEPAVPVLLHSAQHSHQNKGPITEIKEGAQEP
ncbi:hypothetical protein EOD39_15028 [Acipenser ruthenus]|uniref:Uncharacterized protein n=1 Tax=Acipenser ruthenus TaxID=7906 RepID=A0A662YLV2_ACIRT|nr:hypothetical protein EOD39_15028 [Acipenser ruthenus]